MSVHTKMLAINQRLITMVKNRELPTEADFAEWDRERDRYVTKVSGRIRESFLAVEANQRRLRALVRKARAERAVQ